MGIGRGGDRVRVPVETKFVYLSKKKKKKLVLLFFFFFKRVVVYLYLFALPFSS